MGVFTLLFVPLSLFLSVSLWLFVAKLMICSAKIPEISQVADNAECFSTSVQGLVSARDPFPIPVVYYLWLDHSGSNECICEEIICYTVLSTWKD